MFYFFFQWSETNHYSEQNISTPSIALEFVNENYKFPVTHGRNKCWTPTYPIMIIVTATKQSKPDNTIQIFGLSIPKYNALQSEQLHTHFLTA